MRDSGCRACAPCRKGSEVRLHTAAALSLVRPLFFHGEGHGRGAAGEDADVAAFFRDGGEAVRGIEEGVRLIFVDDPFDAAADADAFIRVEGDAEFLDELIQLGVGVADVVAAGGG